MKQKLFSSICLVLAIVIVVTTSTTFAYLIASSENTTDVSGKTADLINTRYAHSLFRRNGFHRYADANGEFLACLLRVEPDGRFILEDQEGKERGYLFKEVQYIL